MKVEIFLLIFLGCVGAIIFIQDAKQRKLEKDRAESHRKKSEVIKQTWRR